MKLEEEERRYIHLQTNKKVEEAEFSYLLPSKINLYPTVGHIGWRKDGKFTANYSIQHMRKVVARCIIFIDRWGVHRPHGTVKTVASWKKIPFN